MNFELCALLPSSGAAKQRPPPLFDSAKSLSETKTKNHLLLPGRRVRISHPPNTLPVSAAPAAEEGQARREGGVNRLLQELESSNTLAIHVHELQYSREKQHQMKFRRVVPKGAGSARNEKREPRISETGAELVFTRII